MRRGNIIGRLERVEVATRHRQPDPANLSEEERYYRFLLMIGRAKRRIEGGSTLIPRC